MLVSALRCLIGLTHRGSVANGRNKALQDLQDLEELAARVLIENKAFTMIRINQQTCCIIVPLKNCRWSLLTIQPS